MRRLRLWIGEHIGFVLVTLVTLYVLGFFLYHTYASVDGLLWQRTVRYKVADACALLVEYPARVSLESYDQPGYPITIRLWSDRDVVSDTSGQVCSTSPSLTEPIAYSADLGPLGTGLEFTDEAGHPAPAIVPLVLAPNESAASPSQLYVRRAPSAGLSSIPLEVEVEAVDASGSRAFLATVPEGQSVPIIHPESERESRWRNFQRVLFDTGPLQWMFTAVGGIVGVWQVYKNVQQRREERRARETERRRVQRERIEALRDEAPSERAFRTYLSLRAEFELDKDMLEELRNAFHPGWLPHLRQQIGRYLRAGHFEGALECLDVMEWEWRQGVDEKTLSTVRALIRHLLDPGTFASRDALQQVLDGFRAIGLEAVQPVVGWLVQAQPDPDYVHDVLFRDGGAGGRYLLSQWGARDEEVARLLRSWEQEAVPPLHRERAVSALWARERGESQIVAEGVHRLGLDFNPFGPEKAEQDPLLPDLFYRLSPVWEEVTAPQPTILIAPPGCGRSALIWMIRYESGLVGSSVGRAFPVFVPLYSFSSAQDLQQILLESLASALRHALARDPYGLLGLEEPQKRGLIQILLQASGGLSPLLRQLTGAGLSPHDPDAQLLREALAMEARLKEEWAGEVDWDVPSFHPHGRDYTFLLVDASSQEAEMPDDLLMALFERWLPVWAPRHVVPKVFLSSEPDSSPLAPIRVEWDAETFSRLLRHRLERAGLVFQENQPALRGWVEGMEDPDKALIEKSGGCPAQLIRIGNRLIRRLAQPQVLTRQEFLDDVLREG